MGNKASKRHPKLERDSSAIMTVLPRDRGSIKGGDFLDPPIEDPQNGVNIPARALVNCMQRMVRSAISWFVRAIPSSLRQP